MVNTNLLKAETIKRGFKDKDVANALKISIQAYRKKLSGVTRISVDDAETICEFLSIKDRGLKADIFLC